jgi:hypothetical protein
MKIRNIPKNNKTIEAPYSSLKEFRYQVALLITTSFALEESIMDQSTNCTPEVSFILNSICNIGIITIKENTFRIAENRVNIRDSIKYFLYGGTKRFSTLKNSFIYFAFIKMTTNVLLFIVSSGGNF